MSRRAGTPLPHPSSCPGHSPGAGSWDPMTLPLSACPPCTLQTRMVRSPAPTPCRPITCFGCTASQATRTGCTSVCAYWPPSLSACAVSPWRCLRWSAPSQPTSRPSSRWGTWAGTVGGRGAGAAIETWSGVPGAVPRAQVHECVALCECVYRYLRGNVCKAALCRWGSLCECVSEAGLRHGQVPV